MITMKVRDVMTTNVITVTPETPLKEVARLMIDHAVSGIPVVDPTGLVVGVVSEADLLVKERGADAVQRRPLAWLIGESRATRAILGKVEATAASDAMTAPPITIGADRPVREAADVMIERRINRLPVVGKADRLLGIITRADIVRAFVRPDAELARIVQDDVIVRALWLDPKEIELSVERGVVHLKGTVERRSTAGVLEHLAGQVDGVVAVVAELDWQFDDSKVEAERPEMLFPIQR